MIKLLHKRTDGTFVALINNLPYHVTQDDLLWQEAVEAETNLENPLPAGS